MQKIQKLDLKIEELERRIQAFASPASSGSNENSTPSRRLRKERKDRRRLLKLKRSIEHLDTLQDKQDHFLRNIIMGPNARYFTLTPEDEALLEEFLQQADFTDDDLDSRSVGGSSCITTAFDVEGDEAVRLAEIESRLDPYKESHSHSFCSASPMASGSTPKFCASQMPSTSGSNAYALGLSKQHEAVSKALEPFAMRTAVDDYLAELKDRREYEEKLEAIDRKLRHLQTAELAAISEEQVVELVNESRKEQEWVM